MKSWLCKCHKLEPKFLYTGCKCSRDANSLRLHPVNVEIKSVKRIKLDSVNNLVRINSQFHEDVQKF